MITLAIANTERYYHSPGCSIEYGPRGGIKVRIKLFRRNGMVKTWKTRPGEFQVPIKHGMYGPSDYITNRTSWYHPESECTVWTEYLACTVWTKYLAALEAKGLDDA